jgi:hypothetical protein
VGDAGVGLVAQREAVELPNLIRRLYNLIRVIGHTITTEEALR